MFLFNESIAINSDDIYFIVIRRGTNISNSEIITKSGIRILIPTSSAVDILNQMKEKIALIKPK